MYLLIQDNSWIVFDDQYTEGHLIVVCRHGSGLHILVFLKVIWENALTIGKAIFIVIKQLLLKNVHTCTCNCVFPIVSVWPGQINIYEVTTILRKSIYNCTVWILIRQAQIWLDLQIITLISILRVSFCSDIWYCNILTYYLDN